MEGKISEALAKKASYSNPNLTLVYGLGNRVMREFDMNAAGFSIIKRYKMLGNRDIMQLESMEKFERNVLIGKIRALDKEWSKSLAQHIRNTMKEFMEANGVSDEDVVSINNDAVTVIQPFNKKHKLVINDLKFKISGTYSSLAVINRVSFYRGINGNLTVKGISDTGRENCEGYLLEKFNEWIGMLENGYKIIEVLKDIAKFRQAYCSRSLPLDYYKNIRNGLLKMGSMGSRFTSIQFYSEFNDSEWKKGIDIGANLIDFIIPFINMLVDRY